MLNDKEKLEYDVLAVIRDSDQPMGCGTISYLLQNSGYNVSEATIGRVLRDLDNQGYTQKAGFQGRSVSVQGLARLSELADKLTSRQWGEEFANALRGHTKEQLLEVLVARRAIESELAYLAAENRTEAEAQVLQEILEKQRLVLAGGGAAAQEDVEFHSAVSVMARNRVLQAAIAKIRQDTQLSPMLEYIRRHVKSLVYIDHRKITEAIIQGQADEARQVMVEHINNLIKDVEKYWQIIDSKTE